MLCHNKNIPQPVAAMVRITNAVKRGLSPCIHAMNASKSGICATQPCDCLEHNFIFIHLVNGLSTSLYECWKFIRSDHLLFVTQRMASFCCRLDGTEQGNDERIVPNWR